MRMGGFGPFSAVNLNKTMWLTPRNMIFGLVVHELWSENPWLWTLSIYYREKWRPFFGRSNSDLDYFFFFKFFNFRIRFQDKKRKVTVIKASERLMLIISRVDEYVSISFWSSSAQIGRLVKNRNKTICKYILS